MALSFSPAACTADTEAPQEPPPPAAAPVEIEPEEPYTPDPIDDPEDADGLTVLLRSLQSAMRAEDRGAIMGHFAFPIQADGRGIEESRFEQDYIRYFLSGTFKDALVGAHPDEIEPSNSAVGPFELVAQVSTPIELENGAQFNAESAFILYFGQSASGAYQITGIAFAG
ncbi:hypothetical protein BH23BAC4_BH23BAC4_04560 [soil metagenome]